MAAREDKLMLQVNYFFFYTIYYFWYLKLLLVTVHKLEIMHPSSGDLLYLFTLKLGQLKIHVKIQAALLQL